MMKPTIRSVLGACLISALAHGADAERPEQPAPVPGLRRVRVLPIALLIGASVTSIGASGTSTSQGALPAPYDTSGIAAEFKRQCAEGSFSGVVEVRARGQLLFGESCGQADPVNGLPNTRDTRFKIYSTSKFITSLAVMRLVERERMSLDAPLGQYLHDVPTSWRPVTIRQLLNHTSGIKDLEPELVPAFHTDFESAFRDMLSSLSSSRAALDAVPGTKFAYNNFGFDLLAVAVQRVTGQAFPAAVQQLVFQPAGMTTASFQPVSVIMGHPTDVPEDGLALGYNGTPGKLDAATSFSFIQLGAGAIRATVADFVALDTALRDGGLVSAEALREMERNPVAPPSDYPTKGRLFGLGMLVQDMDGVRMLGHTGGTNGYISDFERFPDDDAMMIALTNRGFIKTAWLRTSVAQMLKAARKARKGEQ